MIRRLQPRHHGRASGPCDSDVESTLAPVSDWPSFLGLDPITPGRSVPVNFSPTLVSACHLCCRNSGLLPVTVALARIGAGGLLVETQPTRSRARQFSSFDDRALLGQKSRLL